MKKIDIIMFERLTLDNNSYNTESYHTQLKYESIYTKNLQKWLDSNQSLVIDNCDLEKLLSATANLGKVILLCKEHPWLTGEEILKFMNGELDNETLVKMKLEKE